MGGDVDPGGSSVNTGAIPKETRRECTRMNVDGIDGKNDANANPKKHINITYNNNDSGPYRIYCELRDNKGGTLKINKFSLGSELRKLDGFKMFITDMKYVGRHKILVFLSSYARANLLMETINNGNGPYRAYIPLHLVSVTGVVPGIPTELDVEDIKNDLNCDVPIIDVRRMTRKGENGERIPINRISVTFRANELPEKVRFFCCVSKVVPFIPRVVLCLNCLRFGHQQNNCRGAKRCDRCTQRHEDETVCQKAVVCAHCRSSDHNSKDEKCPERKRQLDIKSLMAKRSLTYTEASQQVPVLTRNMYEPLSTDAADFPDLTESFASMTNGRYTWKDPLKEQWIKTNQERKAIQAAVKLHKEQPKIANKRPRVDKKENTAAAATTDQRNALVRDGPNPTTSGTALNNPHSVSEKERWDEMLKEARKEAQATTQKTLQETMMSFYSDFIGMLGSQEDVKSMFKECTKKHFNLANTVVLNRYGGNTK